MHKKVVLPKFKESKYKSCVKCALCYRAKSWTLKNKDKIANSWNNNVRFNLCLNTKKCKNNKTTQEMTSMEKIDEFFRVEIAMVWEHEKYGWWKSYSKTQKYCSD